jgi:hypothetical protein
MNMGVGQYFHRTVRGLLRQVEIRYLIHKLNGSNPRTRAAAALRLSALNQRAEAALPALFAKLQDPDVEVRVCVVEAIVSCGVTQAPVVMPWLLQAIRDPQAAVRASVVKQISAFAPKISAERGSGIRKTSLFVSKISGQFTSIEQTALHVLNKALRDSDPEVVNAATRAITRLGPVAQEAAPALKALAKRASYSQQTAIRRALYSIEDISGAASDGISAMELLREESPPPVEMADTALMEEPTEREPVEMTVYCPREVKPALWYSLLTYIHVPSTRQNIRLDSQKLIDVERARVVGDRAETDIARGAEIRVVPELPGFTVNPPYSQITWLEDWHRLAFRIQTLPDTAEQMQGQAANGQIAFYVEGLLIADVPLSVFIEMDAPSQQEGVATQSATNKPYQSIFVSYSHKDNRIVQNMAAAMKALGMTFLQDQAVLRSGEEWNQRLLQLIGEADIFQLFWSDNAKASPHVQSEWEHALSLQRQNFIRPLYWQAPMTPPPEPLAHLHFSFYPMSSD